MKRNSIALVAISMLGSSLAIAGHEILLDQVAVRGTKTNEMLPTYPSVTTWIDEKDISETINAVDTPDVLKYLPNIFVRKRDSADYTGAPIASRIWGSSYSAKSLVHVDGVPISNQLFNDNTYGTPKWFVVSPEEIKVAEVMYGPYSAAYSGNSMGAVVNLVSKMPTEFTAVVSATGAMQDFKKFDTNDHYFTGQSHVLIGDKADAVSWRVSLTHQDANTQPRAFITSSAVPTPYVYLKKDNASGGFYEGASSLIHGVSDSVNLRIAYDLPSDLRLIISPGVWWGRTDAATKSYMGSYASFQTASAPAAYALDQQHLMNSVTLQSSPRKEFSWEFVVSNFYYDKNIQRWSAHLNTDGSLNTSDTGYLVDYHGTGWTNMDWRANYKNAPHHLLSFGVHYDFNKLNVRQDSVAAGQWLQAESGSGTLYSLAQGVTETSAFWLQDAWSYSESMKVTAGLRAEAWRAHDGYVYASDLGGVQPNSSYTTLSPKLSISWDIGHDWLITPSYGRASRFPTTGELYNVASCITVVGGSCGVGGSMAPKMIPPADSMKPETVNSMELSFEKLAGPHIHRVTLFAQDVKDALLTTLGVLNTNYPTGYYSYWQNVKKVRNYGVEFYASQKNTLIHGLDLMGSLTFVKSEISDTYGLNKDSLGNSIVGHPVPYVPPVRATIVATYRPDGKFTYTVAGRYQRAGASSLDNNDPNPNTYGGFSSYFVMDAKMSYQFDHHWRTSFGIDNIFNKDYFIYHPFPQRTFIAQLKYTH
jgi:iron complex outermembrane receptor protein